MSRRLAGDSSSGYRSTDHSEEIAFLITSADRCHDRSTVIARRLAAELLQAHDETGISLDDWPTARQFVEDRLGQPICPTLI